MTRGTSFARRVFLIAGIYGVIALLPQYFLEERIGRDLPPPITHPEYFYGFVGLALVWQIVFFMVARDVVRFRPLMPVAVLEKLVFGVPAVVLYGQGRIGGSVLTAGLIDLLLACLFTAAFIATARERIRASGARTADDVG